MPLRAFEALNEKQEEQGAKRYANPRNVAAGSVRVLDPEITKSRRLDFYAYYLLAGGREPMRLHSEALEALAKMHFKVSPDWRVCSLLDAVKKFIQLWEGKRAKLPYEIDGIVIKLNEIALQQELDSRQRPRVGGRLQISGAAGNHRCERRDFSSGAHRHTHARGRPRAGEVGA